MERGQCWLDLLRCAWLEFAFACVIEDLPTGFPWLSYIFGFVGFVWRGLKYLNHYIPKIESGNTVHAQTCIKRHDVSFCRTLWNWRLFLAHPTYWHKRLTSENSHNSSWCWLRVFKVSWNNPGLGTIQVCIVVLCFSHNNFAGIHMCEIKRAKRLSHALSTSWPHEQVCSLTIEYPVVQYVPITSISQQCVSKLWTFLQLILVLP